jgi:hypothetical protein
MDLPPSMRYPIPAQSILPVYPGGGGNLPNGFNRSDPVLPFGDLVDVRFYLENCVMY